MVNLNYLFSPVLDLTSSESSNQNLVSVVDNMSMDMPDFDLSSTVVLVAEIGAAIFVGSLTIYLILAMFGVIIYSMMGYIYVLGYMPILTLISMLFIMLPKSMEGKTPESFKLSYIFQKGVKSMLGWVYYFLFVFSTLLLYQWIIGPLQSYEVMEYFKIMVIEGASETTMLSAYVYIIIIPIILYISFLYYMIRAFLGWIISKSAETYIEPSKQIIQDMNEGTKKLSKIMGGLTGMKKGDTSTSKGSQISTVGELGKSLIKKKEKDTPKTDK
jgi:hypothetical protein